MNLAASLPRPLCQTVGNNVFHVFFSSRALDRPSCSNFLQVLNQSQRRQPAAQYPTVPSSTATAVATPPAALLRTVSPQQPLSVPVPWSGERVPSVGQDGDAFWLPGLRIDGGGAAAERAPPAAPARTVSPQQPLAIPVRWIGKMVCSLGQGDEFRMPGLRMDGRGAAAEDVPLKSSKVEEEVLFSEVNTNIKRAVAWPKSVQLSLRTHAHSLTACIPSTSPK